jgi:hypothetical protein
MMVLEIRRNIKDHNWVRRSFLVTGLDIDFDQPDYRYFSTAALKFTSTRLGCNYEINPLPQFTKYADLVPANAGYGPEAAKKMSRYYSEALDDQAQRINLRFGFAQFNDLPTFFSGFYNINAGRLARTGRSPGIMFTLGAAVGVVLPIAVFGWPLLAAHLVGAGARLFLNKPTSKYFYLKPAMPVYWSAVQTILNALCVNTGVVPRIGGNTGNDFGKTEQKLMHEKFPDIFNESGSVNAYAIATKAQRLARAQEKEMEAKLNSMGASDSPANALMQALKNTNIRDNGVNWDKYMKSWIEGKYTGYAAPASDQGTSGSTTNTTASSTQNAGDLNLPPESGKDDLAEYLNKDAVKDDSFKSFFEAEVDDGSAFVTFRVNYTGSVGESFSNSVRDSEIASKMNGLSSQARETQFNFAGGNFGTAGNGVVGTAGAMVTGVLKSASDFISGVGEGLSLSGLGQLAGGGFVDIPKHWDSSNVSLPQSSYTIHLEAPFNNPISRLINIYTPIAMLLAGALPLSTGKQSYTGPFYCEFYDKGRMQSRLAIVSSLAITRGTASTGFTNDGIPLGVDVTIGFTDLSSVMHMPLSASFNHIYQEMGEEVGSVLFGAAGAVGGTLVAGPAGGVIAAAGAATAGSVIGTAIGTTVDTAAGMLSSIGSIFDDDTIFNDYLAVLSSMSMKDQVYGFRKLKARFTRVMTDWDNWFSLSHYASVMGDTIPGRLMVPFYKGTVK